VPTLKTKNPAIKTAPSYVYIMRCYRRSRLHPTHRPSWSITPLCKIAAEAFALFANATASALRTLIFMLNRRISGYHFKKPKIAFALKNPPPKSSSLKRRTYSDGKSLREYNPKKPIRQSLSRTQTDGLFCWAFREVKYSDGRSVGGASLIGMLAQRHRATPCLSFL